MPDISPQLTAANEASYAPAWVRRRLADDPAPLRPGEAVPMQAAVLFADVSGFTPLAERLAQRGAAGAEELSRLLNDYFGQLLGLVAAGGGEPFKFAGDAMMALWPAHDGDLATATQRAAACALAIQAQLHHYETSGGNTLTLRVAVAQGPVAGVALAAAERRYGVVVGPPLNDMVRALSRAQPGDAVLSAAAWAAIVARASASPAGQGQWRLSRVDAAPAPCAAADATDPPGAGLMQHLRGFVPEAARARLAAGHADWLGELRQVTVLFCLIGDLDHMGSEAPGQLQAVMALAEPIVQHCQGHLHEIVVDDKGVVLVVVFGLPPVGHEEGAARGARAALDLMAALGAAGHDAAIGVTTGCCFCGVVGSEVRREYAVVGDTMNVAARLMDAATRRPAGQRLLCDSATAHAAAARVEFVPLAPIPLKGKAEPLPVLQPLRTRSRLLRAAGGMVGREAERQALAQALQRVAAGAEAGTLLVVGDAGIGKSRLMQELFEQAHAAEVATLHGGADAIEAGTPYYAWRLPFAELLGLAPHADVDTRRAEVLRALGPAWAERAPLLEALFALGLPDTPATAELSGQPRALATRELLLALLARAAGARPRCLVLEDAHWFDAASWGLVLEVARRLPRLLLVLTTRPLADPPPAEATALAALPQYRLLRLQPLSGEETSALVCRRLGVSSLPAEAAETIRERAAGLPLFAEELATALLDAGAIEVADGRCRITPGFDLAALALPDTVQGVVTARIDRLSPREALVVKIGSVIGTAFAARVLRDVHPVREDVAHLGTIMQRLNQADLTVLEAPEPALTYAFKHVITREVAYGLMLFAQRRQLHQAVAQWHEQQYGDERPDLLSLLAHHWACAGVVPKAVACLERSAVRSFSMGLGRAAVAQGLEAARLLGVHLPTEPAEIAPLLGAELARIQQLLAGREPAALMAHRPLDNEEAGNLIALLLRFMPFAHQSLQGELFALMALRCMSLTLLHGNGPAAPVVYAMHSIIYRALTGDVVTANRFAELALELDARQGRRLLGPVSFIYTWFNQHWLHPVARGVDMSVAAADAAFESGDVIYGCFNLSAHVVHRAVAGHPLPQVIEVAQRHLARNGRRVLNAAFHCLQELQFAKALCGATASPTSMSDAEYDEQRDVASICATDHYNQIAYYFIARLRLLLYDRQPGPALACAERAQELLQAVSGQVGEFELVFFHALALLARAAELPADEAAPLLRRADELQAQLARWAQRCEANFGHKALLVQAEASRVAGSVDAALYARAAAAAAAAGFVQHEALAHELHAQALRTAGLGGSAEAAALAREAYGRWGALAKVADIDARFG